MDELDNFDKLMLKLENMPFGEEEFIGTDLVERISENKFLVDGGEMDLIGAAGWFSLQ